MISTDSAVCKAEQLSMQHVSRLNLTALSESLHAVKMSQGLQEELGSLIGAHGAAEDHQGFL